jgi:5'-AMP-activated protein kinase regulatory gamma subunit
MSGVDAASSHSPHDAGAVPTFVSPRTLLARPPLSVTDREQIESLRTIRAFLKARTSYDVLPLSYRLIVLDTALLVKKSLSILNQNGECDCNHCTNEC